MSVDRVPGQMVVKLYVRLIRRLEYGSDESEWNQRKIKERILKQKRKKEKKEIYVCLMKIRLIEQR